MPGEILRISRTSADLSQGLGKASVVLVFVVEFVISRSSRFPKFSKSLFVTTWCCNSSMLSVSGNSAL